MEDFLNAIEQDKDLWEALELRVLAIKADGAWHNPATRIWLRSTAPDAPRSEWITTDLVLAERHVMRRDELRTVLTNVAGGQLTLGTTSILYQDTSTGSTPLPLDRWYDWTYRDTDPGNEWLRPYGGRVLHALATTASTLWGRLPNGRQAPRPPGRHSDATTVSRLSRTGSSRDREPAIRPGP